MNLKHLFLITSLVAILFSCKQNTEEKNSVSEDKVVTKETPHQGQASVEASEGEDANVLQVAMSLPDFKTLVVAVQTAGIEDALVNTGPLTVFAPLNSAFDKLPEGTLDNLLQPENKGTLGFILTNHVAPANYPIKQLNKEAKKERKLYMASGKYLTVERKGEDIFVGGTKILKTVKVSNGWIHVIDDVLVPSEK
jgi:uncharacterized surface protein with fasciclin (FAS1) repeats